MPRQPTSSESFSPPLPPNHHLVHLLSPQGSNNFTCVDVVGEERLVEVCSKLRRVKSLIVMRGDFAIVSLFTSDPSYKGGRLVGEIVHILDKSDIKEWKKSGLWPEGFGEKPVEQTQSSDEEEEEDEDEGEYDDEAEEYDGAHDQPNPAQQ
ncbi:hypothetical protein CI109_102276 [Kwoniella shandongensis]|uniref:Uncharacterized protein n=1 Tax=Kwoniella shandongensis TaxID=1734106 RepID=A0A5M6BYI7_9TREE|nr:uncharacterized protein CI109_003570 [Kwoniella shandongensis]KAA5527917.1 hypothetical protein CI109_003570 [Kwoniella shandongensis]